MAWKKTAKENQIPNTTPLVTNDCSMINQAYGAMRWPAVVAALLAAEASTLLYTMVRLTRQATAQLTRSSTRPKGFLVHTGERLLRHSNTKPMQPQPKMERGLHPG